METLGEITERYVAINCQHKAPNLVTLIVSDRKGRDQPSCQEEWKMCRKKRRIVMPM
jgi:hypothetical protein